MGGPPSAGAAGILDSGSSNQPDSEGGEAPDGGEEMTDGGGPFPDAGDGGAAPDAGGEQPLPSPVWFGALRWDAWIPEMVQLGFELQDLFTYFPHREPIRGWFTSNLPSEAEEQEKMDDDIDAAVHGGLHYFAFVWYPKEVPGAPVLHEALDHYLVSKKKRRLKFAVMAQSPHLAYPGDWSNFDNTFAPHLVELMRDQQYVRINGRPVLFLFIPPGLPIPTEKLDVLRNLTLEAGEGLPYLVNVNMDVKTAAQYGYDAVTSYGISGARPGSSGHHCYRDQVTKDTTNWTAGPKSGLKTVMGLTPMNDPRPRTNWPKPYYDYWVDQATRTEWRAEIRAALAYAVSNPTSVPEQPLALLYGWNEIGEGGPGLVPNIQEGARYLDDLRAVLTDDTTRYHERLNAYHCAVALSGTWTAVSSPGSWDSDEHVSTVGGAMATIKSTASAFGFYGSRGPDRGKLEILVDGASRGVVDLYSPTVELQTTIASISGLTPGVMHTVVARVVHLKSAASSDYKVGLDSVRIGAE